MIELSTDDCIAIRGRRVQVWRVTPRWLHLLGDWSNPAIRRLYPNAVRLHFREDFLLDGKRAFLCKSHITGAPRIMLYRAEARPETPAAGNG